MTVCTAGHGPITPQSAPVSFRPAGLFLALARKAEQLQAQDNCSMIWGPQMARLGLAYMLAHGDRV
jgi:hypothetical protein